jgi:Uma2 family endonuclease
MKTLAAPAPKTAKKRVSPVLGVDKTVIWNDGSLHIPGWVLDIESFRQWRLSPDFPTDGNIWWLRGEVWADMSKQQVFSHVEVKGEIFRVLANLVKSQRLGRMFTDGILLSNFAADISGTPDALFLARETLSSDRIRLVEGARGGFTELRGSPDLVLEVLSDSSVEKDLKTLRQGYLDAEIREYWIVDARRGDLIFDILVRGDKGFRSSAKKDGWLASGVFGKSFRLSVANDESGHPEYTLDVR